MTEDQLRELIAIATLYSSAADRLSAADARELIDAITTAMRAQLGTKQNAIELLKELTSTWFWQDEPNGRVSLRREDWDNILNTVHGTTNVTEHHSTRPPTVADERIPTVQHPKSCDR